MTLPKTLTGLAAVFALGACATTTPTAPTVLTVPSVGTVSLNDTTGAYTITINGTPTDLGPITSSFGTGFSTINFAGATFFARGFENADVTAIGGMTEGLSKTDFAGISGTFGTVPTSASGTYTGSITFVFPNAASTTLVDYRTRNLSLIADFGAGTIAQNFNDVVIDGNISGSSFSGNVTWNGKTAPMAGGFYGTNTAAGAFSSTEMAGAFLGTNP